MGAAELIAALAVSLLGTGLALAALRWRRERRSATVRHAEWFGLAIMALALPVAGGAVHILTTADCCAAAAQSLRDRLTIVGSAALSPTTDAPSSLPARPADSLMISAGTLVTIWFGGLAVCLGLIVVDHLRAQRLIRRCHAAVPDEWREALRRAAATLRVSRSIRLRACAADLMPAAVGVFRPAILVPADCAWSVETRYLVMLHELSHVQRRDALSNLVARIACAVHWFNPLAWVIAARLRVERELACDEAVVAAGADPLTYAEQLLSIARQQRLDATIARVAPGLARSTSEVERRVVALVDDSTERGRVSRGQLFRLAVLAMCAASAGAIIIYNVSGRVGLRERVLSLAAADTTVVRVPVTPGAWLEIHNSLGDIVLRPGAAGDAEVRLINVERVDGRAVRISRSSNSVAMCVQAASARTSCTDKPDSAGAHVRWIVTVPHGVRIGAHTRNGSVRGADLSTQLWATTRIGDIEVSSRGAVEASTDSGSIRARIGLTQWTPDLELTSRAGNVTVTIPSSTSAEIEAVAEDGEILTALPIEIVHPRRPRSMATGRIGTSSKPGRLTLTAGRGDVTLLADPGRP